MPIFGQVWLWSLLAFLLGALLCWVLLVLPVRRRIDALESRLATIRMDAGPHNTVAERPHPADRPPSSARGMVPGFDDTGNQEEIRSELLTRAYALPGVADIPSTPYGHPAPDEATERGALSLSGGAPERGQEPPAIRPLDPTQYIGAHSDQLAAPAGGRTAGADGRDWFDEDPNAPTRQAEPAAVQQPEPAEPARPSRHLLGDEEVEERGTIFTQQTMPIPVEQIRRLDEDGRVAAVARPEDSLVDDLGEPAEPVVTEPEINVEVSVESYVDLPRREVDQETKRFELRPEQAEPPAETTRIDRRPDLVEPPAAVTLDRILSGDATPVRSEVDTPAPPEPELERAPEPAAPRVPARAANRHTIDARVASGTAVETDRAPSVLPKRIPSKPQHRAPFGVQTVSPAAAHAAEGGERIRSLFEAVVPAEDEQEAVPPPPNRPRTNDSRPSAPGPFGPGSAMPLPGGASPSPEFTIKASVTALRYCTPESPQFGRTVAEVWFRSAADAERVGFRPVGTS